MGGRTLKVIQELSLPLIAGVVAALVWANVDPHGYHALIHEPIAGGVSLHFLVNDIFMALFFGIAAGEITESCLPGGALNPPRRAVNPLLGTVGGVLGPIAVFFAWMAITGDHSLRNGWGIPTATDIAIAWLVARVAFGARHPAVSYLLLLAVADDGIGLAIIAVFYPDPHHPVQPIYLLIVAAAMGAAYALRRRKVASFWPYVLGPGVVSWWGLHLTGVHPALALVPIVPMLPTSGIDLGLFEDAEDAMPDPLNRFTHTFKLPVDLGLFAFGLANAGVELSSVGNATAAVAIALAVGKTCGVFSFAILAHRLGFPLPTGIDLRTLVLAGMTAGLGLTVALFVAGVAFTDPHLQGAAKMGALLSVVVAPVVITLARVLRIERWTDARAPDADGGDPAYASGDEHRDVASL
ncbi:MAG: sodium:proton antiporter [Deltaproteobacteria bacterium]|nr:MAG: sodium:proton antiporter [Deltaproteobacteria bacterium]